MPAGGESAVESEAWGGTPRPRPTEGRVNAHYSGLRWSWLWRATTHVLRFSAPVPLRPTAPRRFLGQQSAPRSQAEGPARAARWVPARAAPCSPLADTLEVSNDYGNEDESKRLRQPLTRDKSSSCNSTISGTCACACACMCAVHVCSAEVADGTWKIDHLPHTQQRGVRKQLTDNMLAVRDASALLPYSVTHLPSNETSQSELCTSQRLHFWSLRNELHSLLIGHAIAAS